MKVIRWSRIAYADLPCSNLFIALIPYLDYRYFPIILYSSVYTQEGIDSEVVSDFY